MTHHQPTRKSIPAAARDNFRIPVTLANASGDSTNKHNQRSKSKTKVPRSIRYDLENALVNLCDVWFEEIKPYLIRNNVKVHVHGTGENIEAAGGDHEQLAPGASRCSHIDPGAASDPRQRPSANCAGYYLTQRTASRAPCRRPPAPRSPPAALQTRPSTQSPCRNCQENLDTKPRRRCRRKHTRHSAPFLPPQLIARPCRTATILPSMSNECYPQRITHQSRKTTNYYRNNDKSVDTNYTYSISRKLKIKDKWTQTEIVEEKQLRTETKRKSRSKSCSRRNGTTALTITGNKNKTGNDLETTGNTPLFQKDLIDIIGESNDKRLRVLYKSPVRDVCSSIMNLIPCTTDGQNRMLKKPWR